MNNKLDNLSCHYVLHSQYFVRHIENDHSAVAPFCRGQRNWHSQIDLIGVCFLK